MLHDPTDRTPEAEPDAFYALRVAMVAEQIQARGVMDEDVLAACRIVPRHEFVPGVQRDLAYTDQALPIGQGQTISQPYIVALMTSLAQPLRGARVLEIGSGSGYQAALLAELGAAVRSVEIIAFQADRARETLARLGYADRVQVLQGDGFAGDPAGAPYDVILVTCAVPRIPEPLIAQLAERGRLILPLGDSLAYQTLTLVNRRPGNGLTYRQVTGVVFVPMTGPHGF